MHAVGDAIEARRDELARTLTLDQGKPLARRGLRRGRGARRLLADGGRGRQAPGRRAAQLVLARQAGHARAPAARRRRGHQPVELALHHARRADRAGAGLRQHGGVDARALDRGVRGRAGALHRRGRHPARRVQPRDRPGAGRRQRDRRATPASTAWPSSARPTTGRLVAQAAAGKVALLEMGGNGPVVVMDDADVDAAVEATLTACYLCAGQSCTAGERILVHRAVRDEYLEKLARRVTEQVLLGDPFDDATTMGPVNNEQVAAKMDEHVADAVDRGASVVAGGERAGGFPTELYWQATILADVPADARVADRGDVRPGRPARGDRLPRAGHRADQRLALRPALGHLHRRPQPRAAVRRARAHGLGQHQRVLATTGRATSRSAGAPAPTAAWAASAARTSCSSSPSCRPWSSRPRRARTFHVVHR